MPKSSTLWLLTYVFVLSIVLSPAANVAGAPVDDGAVDDGAVDDGAVDDGAVDDGAVDDGAVDDGAVDDGAVDDGKGRLKVFILAGQSNMVGAGVVKMEPKRNEGKGSLEYVVKNAMSPERFQHVVDGEGQWVERDDVWIWDLGRTGRLTVGFGGNENAIGPEFGFGHRVGEALSEPVLLIKVAWGGKSLAKDFRPPSSGGEVGPFYNELLMHVRNVLGDIKKHFPAYDDRGYELVGIGWHQGWNDRVNQTHNDAYEQNMANFIRDIRKDLSVEDLPFVIAETGMSGHEERHPRALSLMEAQAAVAQHPEFKGNVAFVGTKDFYRPKEESPSGQAYHWNSNAETYFLIGDGMAQSMLALVASKPTATK